MSVIYLVSETGLSGLHTLSIGLARCLGKRGFKVGFIKPVGNMYFEAEGRVCDEDAALARSTLDLEEDLDDLCPFVVTPQSLWEGVGREEEIRARILSSFGRVKEGKDIVLVQGAFSSRQGWLLGISAYHLAPLLEARVLLVERYDDASLGDNVLCARRWWEERFVGAVFNMVPAARGPFVEEFLKPRLEEKGVPVLGVLPLERRLRSVSVSNLAQSIHGELLCGEGNLDRMVEDVVVGAMTPEHAMGIFRKKRNYCVVTGGDRSDIQLAAMQAHAACLVLTGNLHPSPVVLGRAEEEGVPVILTSGDTFSTAEKVELVLRSARIHEPSKVKLAESLVEEHVDLQRLLSIVGSEGHGR
jgi:hypothetical protein